MKLIIDNLNPLMFLAGFSMLACGLWIISPHLALIVCGSLLMGVVLVDAGVRIIWARSKDR